VPTPFRETTDWLPGHLKPVHEGVYRRHFPGGPYACWSAHQGWRRDASSPEEAAAESRLAKQQNLKWRGRTRPSSQPCGTCRGQGVLDRGVDPDSGRDLIGECPDC
jgi:hypothetical protein